MSRFRSALLAVAAMAALATPAVAADKVKLGVMLSVSNTPLAPLGIEAQRGIDLALKELGNKLGGLPVEIVGGDPQGKPDLNAQLATKLKDQDKVDFVTGFIASNELMAVARTLAEAGIFVISANAGPSPLAGEQCHENIFVVSFQNDAYDEAMGAYMTRKGIDSVYFMGADYQAGWDHIGGAKRYYKGKTVGEVYTPLRQLDFAAELTQVRAANPEAVFVFYPGALAVAFTKQFNQAGLKGKVKLYSGSYLADEMLFNAIGEDAALGLELVAPWYPAIDNPANKKFVEAFQAEHKRRPTVFAQQAYDAIKLIDSAVAAVDGKIENKDAVRAALKKADFPTTKGKFSFNSNHFPIQDYYIAEVAKDDKGVLYHKITDVALKDHKDIYYEKCSMK